MTVCPYCVRGSWTDSNRQVRRCHFCNGTGQIADAPTTTEKKATA